MQTHHIDVSSPAPGLTIIQIFVLSTLNEIPVLLWIIPVVRAVSINRECRGTPTKFESVSEFTWNHTYPIRSDSIHSL